MKQSSFRYLGLFNLLLVVAFVAVFGVQSLTRSISLSSMVVAGVSAILAGSIKEILLGSIAVSWRHFASLTYALFALILPGSYFPAVLAGTATQGEIGMFAVMSVGGFSMLFFAFDIVRDGKHFEVEPNVDTVVGW